MYLSPQSIVQIWRQAHNKLYDTSGKYNKVWEDRGWKNRHPLNNEKNPSWIASDNQLTLANKSFDHKEIYHRSLGG